MWSDDISISSRLLIEELNILNIFQINILQHLLFMFKVKNSIILREFNPVFTDHIYPTTFSDSSLKICYFNLKLTRFAIV